VPVAVIVRIRKADPVLLATELDRGAKCIVEMQDNQTILTPPPDAGGKSAKDREPKVFAFDKSYWSFDKNAPNYAGQQHLFEDLGKPLLDNAFQGYNNCIFAYGQTGAGKSYSMMGYGKDAGIIPNICQDMFRRINEMQKDPNLHCTVEVSYLEIYNERVRDLLNPANKGNLRVREHPSTGPYVEDLAKLVVTSFQEIEHLMDEGNKARTVAATNMNETSSRSHAVFTIMLTQKRYDPETKMEMEKAAKISLVDLAGSERANSTGATGARLKEGAEINRSLSTLGRVIAALADLSTGKKKKGTVAQVPYRDSVLTWLLKDSLGGNSMTAMIAAISPADINYDETLSTLRYADSAKRIKNHAVINEDANARMIRELKEELALLRSKLNSGAGGGGGIPVDEVYPPDTPLDKQIVSITQPDGTVKKVSKAEIAEQLMQSEKLLKDLNQTWEEKLAKTEAIHKEREQALEELGISIEKGFIGMSTPKKMPHLVNLSDDPLLAECLVYNLKPGLTTVGNVESNQDHQVNIRLNGTKILEKHCVFENAPDGTVTLTPEEGAAVMVNGKRITEKTRLHSGYRIILGDFHIFRFNHPLEARAERAEKAEQSLLRQSITASQLQALEKTSPSPSRMGHDRTLSTALSELSDSRPESPATWQRNTKELDWSFARREAAPAILGTDQNNLSKLTDEELNALFEDVQRARAERVNGREADGEEDGESTTSYPIREKYMSAGTIDNFSLDTALTMPSTPKQGETGDERLREMRDEMQSQLEKQKEEFQEQLKDAEAANVAMEEIKKEKAKMEETLVQLKADMQKKLEEQRREYEAKIERLDPLRRPKPKQKLSPEEIERAKAAVKRWRSRHYVRMAMTVLQHASTLKEAQIMSHELDEHVVFQFTVVDVGHVVCSSYDMVLNGLSSEGDDIALEEAPKPCIGVRVIDYKHGVVHLWSIEKLHDRVRQMRQMYQYLDQPEYAQHLSIDNPFVEACMPQYTLVGEADVPLKAVFESRVQDFTLDVYSPHTQQAIGIIKLALEPSSARAPSNTLKFNVVMHEMIGFAEREGTEVHAQLFIPGISEDGITTTQMIKDFDEGPIRFESVHSMSVPLFAPPHTTLRVAIFAKVSATHLDKLLSWDDMRDAVPASQGKPKGARINEAHFYTEEKHDLLARVQIQEMNEDGEYVPVEVTQMNEMDAGTFQLHQGLQRRIAIKLVHSAGDALPWDDVVSLRVGKVQLLDSAGKTPDMSSNQDMLPLKLAAKPVFRTNANGTRSITFYAQWDSSLHSSLLLDRVTPDKYRVQMTLAWEVACAEKLAEPVRFSLPVCVQVVSRSFVRQTSMFASLWQQIKIVHSVTGIFTLQLRPAPIKRVGDLWRMNSQHDYVKGEENLTAWTPRGVSLVADYIAARKRRRMAAEIMAMQNFLKKIGALEKKPKETQDDDIPPPPPVISDNDEIAELLRDDDEEQSSPKADQQEADQTPDPKDGTISEQPNNTTEPTSEYTPEQEALLKRILNLWQRYQDPTLKLLSPANTSPPEDGAPADDDDSHSPWFVATVVRVPKNPSVLRSGYLLVPNAEATRWVKRFVELRRPYMHVYGVENGEEVAVVGLRNARVESQPGILGLLNVRGGAEDDYGLAAVEGEGDAASSSANTGPNGTPRIGTVSPSASTGSLISSLWPTSTTGSPSPRSTPSGNRPRRDSDGPGISRLSERLQAGVFAVYGTDNTWLFAARSERDKMDWVAKIDQCFGPTPASSSAGPASVTASGRASPNLGPLPNRGRW